MRERERGRNEDKGKEKESMRSTLLSADLLLPTKQLNLLEVLPCFSPILIYHLSIRYIAYTFDKYVYILMRFFLSEFCLGKLDKG